MQNHNIFETSPNLVCLEKSKLSLSLSHYGNLIHYNSFDPELTLRILRELKTPQTVDKLNQEIRDYQQDDIVRELQRLKANSLVWLRDEGPLEEKINPSLLNYFTRDAVALKQLSLRLANTKVGLVDLCGSSTALREQLGTFGISKISEFDFSGEPNREQLEAQDYFLVVGENRNRMQFSKINQLLHPIGRQWTLVTLDLFGGILGPTFGLAGGPCYDCIIDFSKRQYDRRFCGSDYKDLINDDSAERFDLTSMPLAKSVINYAALESVKVLSQVVRPMTHEGFYVFDMFNFRMTYNHISPSPTCPVCSGWVTGR